MYAIFLCLCFADMEKWVWFSMCWKLFIESLEIWLVAKLRTNKRKGADWVPKVSLPYLSVYCKSSATLFGNALECNAASQLRTSIWERLENLIGFYSSSCKIKQPYWYFVHENCKIEMGFRQRRGFNDPWVQTGTFKHEHDNGVENTIYSYWQSKIDLSWLKRIFRPLFCSSFFVSFGWVRLIAGQRWPLQEQFGHWTLGNNQPIHQPNQVGWLNQPTSYLLLFAILWNSITVQIHVVPN